jgi:hypothetical protein
LHPAGLAALATERDVRIKHWEYSARHANCLPAHTHRHRAITAHRIHVLDPHQPGRTGQVTERPNTRQAINAAALTGHLRSTTKPVPPGKVRQPPKRNTGADVKDPLA